MFDLFGEPLGPEHLALGGASLLAGLAAGLTSYVGLATLRRQGPPAGRALADKHRRDRRKRAAESSPLFGLALRLLPPFLALTHAVGFRSLRATLEERYARAGWPGGLEDDELVALSLLLGLFLALPVVGLLALNQPLHIT